MDGVKLDLPVLYEARALIAEGRAHDEVTHRAPPDCDCADRGEPDQNGHEPTCPLRQYGQALLAAAAWKEAHFTELLDGYAAALSEVDRQAWQAGVWQQIYEDRVLEVAQLRAELVRISKIGAAETERQRRIISQNATDWAELRAENTALRATLAKLK